MSEDFKPLIARPGSMLERSEGFVAKYNECASALENDKGALLQELRPWKGGKDNVWHAIVSTAMHYSNRTAPRANGRTTPSADNKHLYSRLRGLRDFLLREEEKRDPGEFDDYRISELIPLLDQIVSARPRPPHGLTRAPVPASLIYELAFIYMGSTGKKPGTGLGHFAEFVQFFWSVMGHERGEDAVIQDIKKARRARSPAFELAQD